MCRGEGECGDGPDVRQGSGDAGEVAKTGRARKERNREVRVRSIKETRDQPTSPRSTAEYLWGGQVLLTVRRGGTRTGRPHRHDGQIVMMLVESKDSARFDFC